jgi:hypothetical protein
MRDRWRKISLGLVLTGFLLGNTFGAIETRLVARVDPQSNEEDPIGFLAGVGYQFTDSLTAGLYASYQGTDRELPVEMSRMYGFGAYAEQDLSVGYALMPFVGASAGLIDTTGPSSPTVFHATGSLGLKYQLRDNALISAAGTFHWADQAIFDYEHRDNAKGYRVSDTDLTLDLGVRFLF